MRWQLRNKNGVDGSCSDIVNGRSTNSVAVIESDCESSTGINNDNDNETTKVGMYIDEL